MSEKRALFMESMITFLMPISETSYSDMFDLLNKAQSDVEDFTTWLDSYFVRMEVKVGELALVDWVLMVQSYLCLKVDENLIECLMDKSLYPKALTLLENKEVNPLTNALKDLFSVTVVKVEVSFADMKERMEDSLEDVSGYFLDVLKAKIVAKKPDTELVPVMFLFPQLSGLLLSESPFSISIHYNKKLYDIHFT